MTAPRSGPRPLGLHLATSAAVWTSSLAALQPARSGLLPWNAPQKDAGTAIRTALAAADPEALAAAVAHEASGRLAGFLAGIKAYPNGAVYGGTKWFVRDFMEVLRMESAMEGTNIRTATLYPAAINTELLDTITDKGTAEGMKGLYETYGISPERIARVVAFALDLPEDTTVNEFTVGPANQPW